MIRIKPLRRILIFLSLAFLFSEKSSNEIQKDIEEKNKEAQFLQSEIIKLAEEIQSKENQSKFSKKKIANIKEKIDLTEQLIELLKKDEKNLSLSIIDTKEKIEQKDQKLSEIKEKFSKMILHLYKTKSDNYLDVLLKSKNWDDMIYKIKYLEILSSEHQKVRLEIEATVDELNNEISLLTNQLLIKKDDKEQKNIAIKELNQNKKNEENKKDEIKTEKFELEKRREKKKILLMEMNKMIENLYVDKDNAKNREEKLRQIREEKARQEKQDLQKKRGFSNLKGKLPWPVNGSILNDYGINNNTGIKERKLWIEIKTNKNERVKSVFDGIVVKIDFNLIYNSYIIIDHGDGYSTLYANLDDQSIQVSEEDYIESQTIIANTLNSENDSYGLLYFMIFELGNDEKLKNYNPKEWIQ